MRKFISFLMTLIIVLSVFTVSLSAREANVYYCPLTKELPRIDGKIREAAWLNALTIEIDAPAAAAHNGWSLYPAKKDTAKGTVKVLWADDKTYGGLYISAKVEDETQSFALDRNTAAPNSMDCVQLVIDPLYQRRAKIKDSAMIYTFLPYTSRSGNGFAIYPEDGALWYEHVYWVGRNESLGIKVASSLDIERSDEDRRWIVSGYSMEIYLPWNALTVLAGTPEAKVGTKMGIGFLLVDYDFDYENSSHEDFSASQKLLNVTADYSNGTRTTQENICAYPKCYNTMVFTDEDGTNLDVTPPDSTHTVPEVNATEEESLKDILAKDDFLNSADYTGESWGVYVAAKIEALKYKDDENSPEGKAAKAALVKAINELELAYNLDNIQEQTDTNSKIAKLTELINSTKNLSQKYSKEQLKEVNRLIEEAESLLSKSYTDSKTLDDIYNKIVKAIDQLPELESEAKEVKGLQTQTVFIICTGVILLAVILILVLTFMRKPFPKKKRDKKD